MKKTGGHYSLDFKKSVVSGPNRSKPLAQIACEHGIHPSPLFRWNSRSPETPENAFIQWDWG